MIPNEVFLSHSSQDHAFVMTMAEVLGRHAIPVWYSEVNIAGSQLWHDEIGVALNRCDWFVVILSPHSVQSLWVKRELLFALQQNRFAYRIIPLLYQPCDPTQLSWVLPQFQIVDFTQSHDADYRALLRIWSVGYRAS
jgi:hypothetical protein